MRIEDRRVNTNIRFCLSALPNSTYIAHDSTITRTTAGDVANHTILATIAAAGAIHITGTLSRRAHVNNAGDDGNRRPIEFLVIRCHRL